MEDFFFSFQNQKHPEGKQNKKRLTEEQVSILEKSFVSNNNKKLEPERKFQLASQLGVPARQVAIWFQNKRARWKTQSLELEHGALQLKLESVLSEKRKLEKEVERLKAELNKAQEMLVGIKGGDQNAAFSEFSVSCEEGGSSGCDANNGFWQSGEVLQVEDLYACYMSAKGSRLD
ncbi:hypothetical protein L6164_018413 [Bauhinia variegata]|uniref:Uncharacterized protein n=1 Tax=Bauhinia variegata TaxID=167791 RepID=A0ACB9NCI7_BAUVA|nr:hypothetical protein L6164_018413 [Bauhinia variegata]